MPSVPKTTEFTATVPTSGTISNVQVHMNVNAPDFVDHEFTLISPKGTVIPLVNSGGNFFPIWDGKMYGGVMADTVWNDAAATPFSRAPFSPGINQSALAPEGALAALTGQDAKGTWKLQVVDLSNTGEGQSTLNSWDLIVTTSTGFASPYTGPITAPNPGGGGGGGGTTVTISSETQCAAVPRISSAKSIKAKASSASFNAIQQAVATAAKRGAAIDAWLKAGIATGDLCGGAIGQKDLSVASGAGTSLQAIDAASPRAIAAPTATLGKKRVVVTLAKAKALQASSVAALKRAKALDARINGNLTGGDLLDGAITTSKLNRGLVVTGTTGASAGRSVTNTGAIKVKALKKNASVVQVLASAAANQQQANVILTRLRATLQTGLTGANFKDGSIGVAKVK
ncbi:MAG: proprotein convertase P-domain-containing protein [Thermoleophilia bacterium]